MAEQKSEIWVTLSGSIDPAMVQKVFQGFANSVGNGVKKIHLLIHSTGGFVNDGVCLYNYLRNLPLELVTYNAGGVSSIAVTVFLAGKVRKASAAATFLVHKTFVNPSASAPAYELQRMADGLMIDDARTEEILRQHIKFPPDKWEIHKRGNLTITAKEALEFGLIHEIADFSAPAGNVLYNI